MDKINKLKTAIRSDVIRLRRGLDQHQRLQFNEHILRRLTALQEIQKSTHVFCYVSTKHEVDTHSFIDWLMDQGKQVSIPRIVNGELKAVKFSGWPQLEPGQFGILEPIDTDGIDVDIDVCVTPGIGFSRRGARLGHGMGYYDRWFSENSVGVKIAPAYQCQIIDDLPVERHDIHVDLIVTEDQIIRP